jgi:hypothetical protein
VCMKDVNARKLAVPRERGAPRTDHDQLGNVPLGWSDTSRSASPADSGFRGDDGKRVASWRNSAVINVGSPAITVWLAVRRWWRFLEIWRSAGSMPVEAAAGKLLKFLHCHNWRR